MWTLLQAECNRTVQYGVLHEKIPWVLHLAKSQGEIAGRGRATVLEILPQHWRQWQI